MAIISSECENPCYRRLVCTNNVPYPSRTRQVYLRPIYRKYIVRYGNQCRQGVRLIYEKYNEDGTTCTNQVEYNNKCCQRWSQLCNSCNARTRMISTGCPSAVSQNPCIVKSLCESPINFGEFPCENQIEECNLQEPCECEEPLGLDDPSCSPCPPCDKVDQGTLIDSKDLDYERLEDRLNRLQRMVADRQVGQANKNDIRSIYGYINRISNNLNTLSSRCRNRNSRPNIRAICPRKSDKMINTCPNISQKMISTCPNKKMIPACPYKCERITQTEMIPQPCNQRPVERIQSEPKREITPNRNEQRRDSKTRTHAKPKRRSSSSQKRYIAVPKPEPKPAPPVKKPVHKTQSLPKKQKPKPEPKRESLVKKPPEKKKEIIKRPPKKVEPKIKQDVSCGHLCCNCKKQKVSCGYICCDCKTDEPSFIKQKNIEQPAFKQSKQSTPKQSELTNEAFMSEEDLSMESDIEEPSTPKRSIVESESEAENNLKSEGSSKEQISVTESLIIKKHIPLIESAYKKPMPKTESLNQKQSITESLTKKQMPVTESVNNKQMPKTESLRQKQSITESLTKKQMPKTESLRQKQSITESLTKKQMPKTESLRQKQSIDESLTKKQMPKTESLRQKQSIDESLTKKQMPKTESLRQKQSIDESLTKKQMPKTESLRQKQSIDESLTKKQMPKTESLRQKQSIDESLTKKQMPKTESLGQKQSITESLTKKQMPKTESSSKKQMPKTESNLKPEKLSKQITETPSSPKRNPSCAHVCCNCGKVFPQPSLNNEQNTKEPSISKRSSEAKPITYLKAPSFIKNEIIEELLSPIRNGVVAEPKRTSVDKGQSSEKPSISKRSSVTSEANTLNSVRMSNFVKEQIIEELLSPIRNGASQPKPEAKRGSVTSETKPLIYLKQPSVSKEPPTPKRTSVKPEVKPEGPQKQPSIKEPPTPKRSSVASGTGPEDYQKQASLSKEPNIIKEPPTPKRSSVASGTGPEDYQKQASLSKEPNIIKEPPKQKRSSVAAETRSNLKQGEEPSTPRRNSSVTFEFKGQGVLKEGSLSDALKQISVESQTIEDSKNQSSQTSHLSLAIVGKIRKIEDQEEDKIRKQSQ